MRPPGNVRLIVAMVFAVATARAGAGDAAARKDDTRAMDAHFAAGQFDEAKALLQQALAGCRHCSNPTRAQLHRDLGVVLITGFGDTEHGRAEMTQARTLDPKIALDPMVTTKEVQQAFDAAAVAAASNSVTLDDEGGGDAEDEDEKPKKRAHVTDDEEQEESDQSGCRSDADCGEGNACAGGECRPKPPREHVVWLSLGVLQDMLFVSGSDVCSKDSQVSGGFTCLRASGSQYHGTPLPGNAGSASTLGLGATRATLATNVRVGRKISLGLRVGFALAGKGPQPDGGKAFLPLLGEVSGAYWLSSSAFGSSGISPFVELAGGVAQIDGKASVNVKEDPAAPRPISQLDNPPSQRLDAYRKTGAGFAGAGAGLFLPIGTGGGVLADLRVSGLFPSPGVAMSFGISGALGL